MPGGKFVNLGAPHTEGIGPDAKTYTKGEEFESEKDLDVLFANHFQRVEGKAKRPRDRDASLDNSGRVMDKDLAVRGITEDPEEKLKTGRKNRGFAAKAKDGLRRSGADPDETDEIDPVDEEEEDNKVKGRKAKADEGEDADSDETEIVDENREEDDDPDVAAAPKEDKERVKSSKKKKKMKAKKAKKSSDEDED